MAGERPARIDLDLGLQLGARCEKHTHGTVVSRRIEVTFLSFSLSQGQQAQAHNNIVPVQGSLG